MESGSLLSIVVALAVIVALAQAAEWVFRRAQDQLREENRKTGRKLTQAVDAIIEEASAPPPQTVEVGTAVESESVQPITVAVGKGVLEQIQRSVNAEIAAATAAQDREIEEAAKSIWSRTPVIVAAVAALGVIGGGLITGVFGWLDNEPLDCTAYVNTLLSVHERASSNEDAVAAVNALEWGSLDDDCGSPALFIEPLGDYTPPTGG